ncbi:ADP-ribosylglycohydrolase [Kutzneria viridogrisea]|uniref:ADP-ribosylglycohydrolase n=1 Tax=Kutzneria viridogrisea TaxID=47990 RepID=A0ABR6BE75_9PSEU|nr:ADP-ribosylglycohydrolase [Kutzneria viridogrisea]
MYRSLDGLSAGDCLGAQFFVPGRSVPDLIAGIPPEPVWEWTDDTEMACGLVAHLRDRGQVDQDALAAEFAERCEPYRGYGAGAVVTLRRIRQGEPWATVSAEAFGGTGSCGNGAAMRVAPLGAFFAGDPVRAAEQAALSAQVTHLHPEGVAGAVAVAVAAALLAVESLAPQELLDAVARALDAGQTRRGIERARELVGSTAEEAAHELGNGSRVIAQDTVPFSLWAAATHLTDFRAGITACVRVGGDVDTTGAIVGGLLGAHGPVPADWLAAREPLPAWAAREHHPADD